MSSPTANDANDVTAQPLEDLVLQDQAGTYYRLTPEMLEQARVHDEQRAALQQQLREADDTTGYLPWICIIAAPSREPRYPPGSCEDRYGPKFCRTYWGG